MSEQEFNRPGATTGSEWVNRREQPDYPPKPDHEPDWHELGRVFPFPDQEQAFDPEYLSPHGHMLNNEDGSQTWVPSSHEEIVEKVQLPKPMIILQDQDPAAEKDITNVELTDEEWDRLLDAYERGVLDPDGNGTNRLLSQGSLRDLGLGRIEDMLGPGRRSGSVEGIF